jgi:spore germination cell wall hydrolase CwlJ-like protein
MSSEARALDQQQNCIARAIYWEARGLSENGMRAVAEVIHNRMKHPNFPKTACAVVYQRSNSVCQFSWVCTNARNIVPPNNVYWQRAKTIAQEAPTNLTNGALFFHAKRYRSRWRHLLEVAEIDNHIFYSTRR